MPCGWIRIGAAYYVDEIPLADDPAAAEAAEAPEAADAPAPAVDNAFALHSRPGAANTIYLDFNGHTLTKTAWNSTAGADPLVARPFDLDGAPGTFSAAERAAIAEIWHRVAEDYAAFDIDVTTEEPASFGPTVGRSLITAHIDANGKAMPASSAGGVAYVGVFGASNCASYYSPALVYFDNMGNGTTSIAEAASHEFGHNLGLSHDGTASVGYYSGHGSGAISWGPIMGVGYYQNVTQWSKGEYAGANNTQDDIAIVASDLGFADDDHGNTPAAATPLVVSANGQIAVTNPETDADNRYPENKGSIGERGDKDVFRLAVGAGTLSLTLRPAWDAFYRTARRGANLDLRASLTDDQGNAIAQSDPADNTDATVSANVPAGTYYLEVSAVGSVNYSDYASQGQYFISGQATPSTAINQPPTAAFGVACAGVQCTFTDSSTDSDGQISSRTWAFGDGGTATGSSVVHTYAAGGTFSVTLTVTDDDGASASTTKSVTVTVSNVNQPPTAVFDATCVGATCTFTDHSSDSDGQIASRTWAFGDGRTATGTGSSVVHTYAAGGTYSVKLTVTDDDGASASTTKSVTATVSNTPPTARFAGSCSGRTCRFSDRSNDPDGTIQSWVWSFGDGTGSTAKNPTHTYAVRSTYTITLTVTDNGKLSSTASAKITLR